MVHNGQYVYPKAYVTERQSALLDAKPEPEIPHPRLLGGRPITQWVYLVPFGRYTWKRLTMQQLAVMPIMQCNGIWQLASLPVGSTKISKSQ